jgi:hypothetical protein
MKRMTEAQRDKLWDLCGRYNVPFRETDYVIMPEGSIFGPPNWVQGWVGGESNTIFVGVSPEGESHS